MNNKEIFGKYVDENILSDIYVKFKLRHIKHEDVCNLMNLARKDEIEKMMGDG